MKDRSLQPSSWIAVLGTGSVLWATGLSVGRVAVLICLLQVICVFSLRLGSCEHGALGPMPLVHVAVALAIQALPIVVPNPILTLSISAVTCFSTYTTLVRMPRRPLCSLEGRVIIVTGCSSGIGLETSRQLLSLGATVVFACRSESRAQSAMREASREARGRAVFLALDLSDCESVRASATEFCRQFTRCDALVCNAGANFRDRALNAQGWEQNMASNHLGHFLLIKL